MEEAIFGGYVEHVASGSIPTAPPPALFADAPILGEAAKVRERDGDERVLRDAQRRGIGDGE